MFKALKLVYDLTCTRHAGLILCFHSSNVNLNRFMSNGSTDHNINVVPLKHRSLLQVSGKDSLEFLQGLVTNDVEQLKDKKCMYALMLNQKGRVMHDFILYDSMDKNTVLVECETESVDAVIKTLKLYKLRKKVEINALENMHLLQVLVNQRLYYPGEESIVAMKDKLFPILFASSLDPLFKDSVIAMHRDPRLSWLGWRVVSNSAHPCPEEFIGSEDKYHLSRYFYGVAEGPSDLLPSKSLPIESNGDYMNGINFNKGCYLGQELTARSHFSGITRKRLVPLMIEDCGKQIEPGTKLYDSKGNVAGKLRSTYGDRYGLGLVNLDRLNVKLVTPKGVTIRINKTYWWPDPNQS